MRRRLQWRSRRTAKALFPARTKRRSTSGTWKRAKSAEHSRATPGEIRRTFQGHTGAVRSLAFSPDGRLLASSGHDGAVCVWEFESGKIVHRLTVSGPAVAVFVAFSQDGGRLVTGSYDHSVKLWDAKTGKELRRLDGHTQPIHAVAFTNDGRKVLSASIDKTVRVWDAASGTELHRYTGHSGEALGLACTPDGRHVLSASYDKTVRIWRLPK
jgi:WD40 repeat protein